MRISPKNAVGLFCIPLVFCFMIYARGICEAFICMLTLAVHEGSHIITASFLGMELKLPRIAVLGLRFDVKNKKISSRKGALLYASGSIGNLLLAVFVSVLNSYIYIGFSEFLIFYNLIFAAINMIPAYPMDAARMLNCILCAFVSELKAVRITVYISRIIAYIMFLGGLYVFVFTSDNVFLMLISLTVLISSRKESISSEAGFLENAARKYMNDISL